MSIKAKNYGILVTSVSASWTSSAMVRNLSPGKNIVLCLIAASRTIMMSSPRSQEAPEQAHSFIQSSKMEHSIPHFDSN